MPFLDTNIHLTTKPYNFDIKCRFNSESYDQHGFFGTKFRGVRVIFLNLRLEIFSTRESTLGLTGWNSSTISMIFLSSAAESKPCIKYNNNKNAPEGPGDIE